MFEVIINEDELIVMDHLNQLLENALISHPFPSILYEESVTCTARP